MTSKQERKIHKIFIASPGDVHEYRKIVEDTVKTYDASLGRNGCDLGFEIAFQEQISGAVGRPQGHMNGLLGKTNFSIVLFGNRWGSNPVSGFYTSGTEEELFESFISLKPHGEREDVWVCFIEHHEDSNAKNPSTPGENVEPEIEQLRRKFRDTRTCFYETVDSRDHFRRRVQLLLESWKQKLGDNQESFTREDILGSGLTTSTGIDILGLYRSYYYAQSCRKTGKYEEAIESYEKSFDGGLLEAGIELANYLIELNKVEKASKLAEEIYAEIKDGSPNGYSFQQRIDAQETVATLQRRLGRFSTAIAEFRHIKAIYKEIGIDNSLQMAKVCDKLGLCLMDAAPADPDMWEGYLKTAGEVFEEAHKIRDERGDSEGQLLSKVNIARLQTSYFRFYKSQSDYQQAKERSALAEKSLIESKDEAERFNHLKYLPRIYSHLAKVLFERAKIEEDEFQKRVLLIRARKQAELCCEKNIESEHTYGSAIAWGQLAQIHSELGEWENARASLEECENNNAHMGQGLPAHLLDLDRQCEERLPSSE
ncbi:MULTISPECIES: lipopolysaccharide assembly protein LapB [unclassified Corynebacterium]|uniref:tetratricopeptide repeat protein n=1 Tax=unclassified Corynebacterium TaxID=2624378 RepID=UPI0021691F89|nr:MULTISPECIES: hypothetical protein [unclassified Corynebacterium]MCS4492047.1 hypothetical protein [Corynebacterium sp. ES2715-CONJ3]MCS4532153.1 hypothetical protein [Corynebacterium sp. ES2730-CONJ]